MYISPQKLTNMPPNNLGRDSFAMEMFTPFMALAVIVL
jgi:hypothetical protein